MAKRTVYPEYLVCLECETPCYEFAWKDGEIQEILCLICGNEDPEQFMTSEDLEAMADSQEHSR
jgi:uncharacterized Zn finger protein (UPF0148 family)